MIGAGRSGLGRRAARGASLLAIAALAGCASSGPAYSPYGDLQVDAEAVPQAALTGRAAYEYHVLAGEMAIQRNDRDRAAREYVAALEYSNDAALAQRATRIALFADAPDLAYRAARIWASGDPGSLDAQRTALGMALINGDAEAMTRHAPALVAAAASPQIGYRLLTEVLSSDLEHADAALEAARATVAGDPNSAPAQHALGVLALRYDREQLAAQAAEAARRLDPDWNDALLLQAGVWIRAGLAERARELVDSLEGNAATRAEYHLTLARLLVEADEAAAALDEFEAALALAPDNADARYGLAVVALGVGDLERAEAALTRLYDANERPQEAAFYLASVYEERGDYGLAQRWYQRVEEGGHAFESQVRAARMIYEQGDLTGAQQRLAELRDDYPDLIEPLYAAEGQLLFEAQEYRAALDIYNRGLGASQDSNELRYGRSIVYERLGDIDAARADLEAILEEEPDDTRALNALGYLMTNHGGDYEQALQLIERALETEPDNPAILDSMGWAHFKLGHLIEARRYLERAYAEFQDAEVAAHLGEVLWVQGQHEAARRIWQGARADDPDHPVLLETLNRLDP